MTPIINTPVKVTTSCCQSLGSPSLFDYSEASVLSEASPSRLLFCWFLSQPALPPASLAFASSTDSYILVLPWDLLSLLRPIISFWMTYLIPLRSSGCLLFSSESIIHIVVVVKGQCLHLRYAQAGHTAALLVCAPNIPLGYPTEQRSILSLDCEALESWINHLIMVELLGTQSMILRVCWMDEDTT